VSSNFQTVELIRRSLRMAELQLEKRDWAECRKHLDIAGNTLKELEPNNDRPTANRKRKAQDTASA
jgi:hypothetical protein